MSSAPSAERNHASLAQAPASGEKSPVLTRDTQRIHIAYICSSVRSIRRTGPAELLYQCCDLRVVEGFGSCPAYAVSGSPRPATGAAATAATSSRAPKPTRPGPCCRWPCQSGWRSLAGSRPWRRRTGCCAGNSLHARFADEPIGELVIGRLRVWSTDGSAAGGTTCRRCAHARITGRLDGIAMLHLTAGAGSSSDHEQVPAPRKASSSAALSLKSARRASTRGPPRRQRRFVAAGNADLLRWHAIAQQVFNPAAPM